MRRPVQWGTRKVRDTPFPNDPHRPREPPLDKNHPLRYQHRCDMTPLHPAGSMRRNTKFVDQPESKSFPERLYAAINLYSIILELTEISAHKTSSPPPSSVVQSDGDNDQSSEPRACTEKTPTAAKPGSKSGWR
jgi:hypothetical protein